MWALAWEKTELVGHACTLCSPKSQLLPGQMAVFGVLNGNRGVHICPSIMSHWVSPLTWMPARLLPNSCNVISLRLLLWTLISPASVGDLWPSTHFAVPPKSRLLEQLVVSVCVSLTLSSSCPWSLERLFAPWNFSISLPTSWEVEGGAA